MKHRLLKGFSLVAAFGTYLILLMGALVTKTGSGEGCGNTWPFCHGEILPSYHTLELWIEYSHRIVSGLVGMIVVILAIAAWLMHPSHRTVKFLAFNSVFFIVLQGMLGAAAVVWGQSDAVLALHFGFSLISFASVALLAVWIFRLSRSEAGPQPTAVPPGPPVSQRLKYGIWGLAVFTYVVVYTGAFVRHTGSSLGCASWPLCGDQWLPDLTSQAGIQMLHRWFAALLFFFVLWLFWAVIRTTPHRRDLYLGSLACLILTLLQVVSGGAIVLTKLELMIALFHTTLVSAFFAALCYLCMQVGLPWRRDSRDNSPSRSLKEKPLLQ